MNISKISFSGSNNNRYEENRYEFNGRYAEKVSSQRAALRKNSGLDSFSKERKSTLNYPNKKKKTVNPYKLALLGLAFLKGISVMHSCSVQPDKSVSVGVDPGTSIEDIADIYGIDSDVIKAYNGLEYDITQVSDAIVIPSDYEHPLNARIASMQEDLFNANLDPDKRAELESSLADLLAVQELQSKTAKTYTDGKFVYFLISCSENSEETGYSCGINVEKFKDIFGIKDGALRNNNNIDFDWAIDDYGGYKDYTSDILHDGEVVKVPVSAISLREIKLLNG